MSGYITFWSKEYVKELEKAGDSGPLCVVYGSQHTRMPYISSLRVGDVIYPVALRNKRLCVMARLPIKKIEPAFDYIMRETGQRHGALIPEDIAMKSQGKYGEFYAFSGGSGYKDKITLPDSIHTIIDEDALTPVPHKYHQEPIMCCADLAASGEDGSEICPRLMPPELVPALRFGKTRSSQKPLKLDKDGCPTSVSLSGFVRKMSDETFEIFESLFDDTIA